MTESNQQISDITHQIEWLNTYLQSDESKNKHREIDHKSNSKTTTQYLYCLPLCQLRVLKINSGLLASDTKTALEATRSAAIKFALRWKKNCLKEDRAQQVESVYILVLDITPSDMSKGLMSEDNQDSRLAAVQSFGAQYAIKNLATDANDTGAWLQVFSWQDWQTIVATLQSPSDLSRLLQYHQVALERSSIHAKPEFDSELDLLAQFMRSSVLYAHALSIDNALIKYGVQDKPNKSLVSMSVSQNEEGNKAKAYHEQMRRTAVLWAQLSKQMLSESATQSRLSQTQSSKAQLKLWQQILLGESLFSRHELIRTLYQHPDSSAESKQSGYVVHQHSYEHLGRHYVFIFYGQTVESNQSRVAIAPNLATIAKDVSSRLPIAELHQVIVLGIAFVENKKDTFIDIDLFIQPVTAMSVRERKLTQQLQRLKQHHN